jgi:enoyl-CoA hydratase/carnithine racemase
MYRTVLYEKNGPIAKLTLNRTERLNTYNMEMRDELSVLFTAIRDDPEVQAVLITGKGRAFSAGADLTEFNSFPSVMEARRIRWIRDVWGMMLSIQVPILVAAHGFCFGDGLEIALLADLRYSANDTLFGLPETKLGFLPGAGGSQTLPRTVGLGPALDILLSGKNLEANEAFRLGLVQKILPQETLFQTAEYDLLNLLKHSKLNIRLLKRSVVEGMDRSLDQGLLLEQLLSRF